LSQYYRRVGVGGETSKRVHLPRRLHVLARGQLYQQNFDLLPDQFIFGSAYPFGNVDRSAARTFKLPVSATTMKKYFYDNAAQLLKL
jgi:predicted TIM-barrel fold metal-dependent hydrolase